ncbi:MAG: insulinase family protein [Acidobacteria bacterium]|nr:MAG: insulinase family protein [Acidobacteriota bacterium]
MKRSLLIFSLLFCLLEPTALRAEVMTQRLQRQATKPTAAAPATARLPEAKLISHVLPNGLEIIVLEDHSIPLVTVELAVKNGSYTEPPELNGLSHLYEHMFFKQNRATANAEDYLRTIGSMGIAYNGTTREEVVDYYFTTTSPNLRTAMQFMKDATRYPLFDEREFGREKQVVIGEIDRNESNPFFGLTVEMNQRMFSKYTSRKNPLGNRQTVGGATTEMMRLIQQRYYVPNNSALVLTGDVLPADVFKMAEELYGDWPRREKDPFVEFPLMDHPALTKSEGAVVSSPIQNVIIDIGWHGPSIGKDNPATYAADVFSFILRQPNSRFQRNLVDTGLVTGVDLSYYTQRNVGPIALVAQTTPDKAHAAIKAIYEEVSHFNDKDYFTDEQLESAKALLEADDLYSREKLSDYTHTLSFWWASTGLEYFRGYLTRLRATSRADISRYITTYIQGKPHVGLALMSTEAQAKIKVQPEELIGVAFTEPSAATPGVQNRGR